MFVQAHTMTLLLGICGLMLGIGFLVGDAANPNYATIISFASPNTWALGFFVYSIIKLYQTINRVPHVLKIANAVQGIWAWSFIFLSFVIFDPTPIAPTEIMLLVPLVSEVWELVIDIFNFNTCPHRRKEEKHGK